MFSVVLLYILTFLFHFSAVRAIPSQRNLPPVYAIASRDTSRQIDAFLSAHNDIRLEHGVPPLKWSNSLAAKATFWADRCNLKHSDGILGDINYGENIVAGTGNFTIDDAVASFINDKDNYDPARPSYLRFTQVVWRSTTELGCSVSVCENFFDPKHGRANYYVCLYNPAGNVIGQAAMNVPV